MNKKEEIKPHRSDRKAMIMLYLEKEVGFTKDQLERYAVIQETHRSKVKPLFENLTIRKETAMKELAANRFSDSAIDNAAMILSGQQKTTEVIMFHHLKDIRNICTPQQLTVFDTGFYKLILKRGMEKKRQKGSITIYKP